MQGIVHALQNHIVFSHACLICDIEALGNTSLHQQGFLHGSVSPSK